MTNVLVSTSLDNTILYRGVTKIHSNDITLTIVSHFEGVDSVDEYPMDRSIVMLEIPDDDIRFIASRTQHGS